jgi:hypothetical protein
MMPMGAVKIAVMKAMMNALVANLATRIAMM